MIRPQLVSIDEGFPGSATFDSWTLDFEPSLESIRDGAKFNAIQKDIATAIDPMRTRVYEAQSSGEWATLRELIRPQTTIQLDNRAVSKTVISGRHHDCYQGLE